MKITSWNEEKAHQLTKGVWRSRNNPMSTKHSNKNTPLFVEGPSWFGMLHLKNPLKSKMLHLKILPGKRDAKVTKPIIFRFSPFLQPSRWPWCKNSSMNPWKKSARDHTCTKEHLNGMVEWPFYGVFCDLQRSGMKRSRVESHGHQMFVLLCLQNQKTVALLPKSLLLDPRFPVFLQGFLASYPPWWNQNCQRQTSKKSAKSGEISPTRKDGAKNLSFCYMDKLPFFCSVNSPRNFETCHQTGCSNPPV